MTIRAWLLPIMVFSIGLFFFAPRAKQISNLEEEIAILKTKIDSHQSHLSSSARQHERRLPEELKWENTISTLSSNRMIFADFASRLETAIAISQMRETELLLAIEDLMSRNMDKGDRQKLLGKLLLNLAKRAPHLAIQKSIAVSAQLEKEGHTGVHYIQQSFSQWSQMNLTGAVEWLDRQIETGKLFNLNSHQRLSLRSNLEKTVIEQLLKWDISIAEERLIPLSPKLRQSILWSNLNVRPSPEQDTEIANFYRRHLPSQAGNEMVDIAKGLMNREGHERVDLFLANIAASEEERFQIVQGAIELSVYKETRKHGIPTGEVVSEIHRWVSTHFPDEAEKMTGEAIAEMFSSNEKDLVLSQILKIHQERGDDDLLAGILEKNGSFLKQTGHRQRIVEAMTDPELRRQYEEAP